MTRSAVRTQNWTIAGEDVNSADAMALLREYRTEIADRYRLLHEGRRSTDEEIERDLAGLSGTDLEPPYGILLLGKYGGQPAGCAGLRTLDTRTAELKRMFIRPPFRGTGGGHYLLDAIDTAARDLGVQRIVLDTRLDLVEARALYSKHGYTAIDPYNTNPHAEAWYAKTAS